jgi:hypothetical protein
MKNMFLSIISRILGLGFSLFLSKKLLNMFDQIQGWSCLRSKAFITDAGSFDVLESQWRSEFSASRAHNPPGFG